MDALEAIFKRRSIRSFKDIELENERIIPLNMVYFGYPNEIKEGRTRYDEKHIYWQTYEPDRKHKTKHKPVIGHY